MFLTKSSLVSSPAWLERISLIKGGSTCGVSKRGRFHNNAVELWKKDESQQENMRLTEITGLEKSMEN